MFSTSRVQTPPASRTNDGELKCTCLHSASKDCVEPDCNGHSATCPLSTEQIRKRQQAATREPQPTPKTPATHGVTSSLRDFSVIFRASVWVVLKARDAEDAKRQILDVIDENGDGELCKLDPSLLVRELGDAQGTFYHIEE